MRYNQFAWWGCCCLLLFGACAPPSGTVDLLEGHEGQASQGGGSSQEGRERRTSATASAPLEGELADCALDVHCDDGDGCTRDRCVDGECAFEVVAGCLSCVGRCDELHDSQLACSCDAQCPLLGDCCDDYARTCEPCSVDLDCNDGIRCTVDFCADGACAHIIEDDACYGISASSPAGSCQDRCFAEPTEEQACQCDGFCDIRDDCCADFNAQCGGSCEGICGLWHEHFTCQCDDGCDESGNCCEDYVKSCVPVHCADPAECDDGDPCTHDICRLDGTCYWDRVPDCEGTGLVSAVPTSGACLGRCGKFDQGADCQCDAECLERSNCCSDFESACALCDADADCTASWTCTAAICSEGICSEAAIDDCLTVNLPYEEEFGCGSESAAGWSSWSDDGLRLWAVDSAPASPEPWIGSCTLNASEWDGFQCPPEGLPVPEGGFWTTARSPWIDATGLEPDERVDLVFGLSGGWGAQDSLSFFIERDDEEWAYIGEIEDPPTAESGWEFYEGRVSPNEDFHVAGHKFRVEIAFITTECTEGIRGPFLDYLQVYAHTCDDGDPCTDDVYDPLSDDCEHFTNGQCCAATCGDGVCSCDEVLDCEEDCVGCAEGACCNDDIGTFVPATVQCGDDELHLESTCVGQDIYERSATAGCDGQNSSCTEQASSWSWSGWAYTKTCAGDELCIETGSLATCYATGDEVAAPCDESEVCCDPLTGRWKPPGSLCDPEVREVITACDPAMGVLVERIRRDGCNPETGACSADHPSWVAIESACSEGCHPLATACAEGTRGCIGECCSADGEFIGEGQPCKSEPLDTELQCQDGNVWERRQLPTCDAGGLCTSRAWSAWQEFAFCGGGELCHEANGSAACVRDDQPCLGVCCEGGGFLPAGTVCGAEIDSTTACSGELVVRHVTFGSCTGSSPDCAADSEHQSVQTEAVIDCSETQQVCVGGACAESLPSDVNITISGFVNLYPLNGRYLVPGEDVPGEAEVCNTGEAAIEGTIPVAVHVSHEIAAANRIPAAAKIVTERTLPGLSGGECMPFKFRVPRSFFLPGPLGVWKVWVVVDPVADHGGGYTAASPGEIAESGSPFPEVTDNIAMTFLTVAECLSTEGACCSGLSLVAAGTRCNTSPIQQWRCGTQPHQRQHRTGHVTCDGTSASCRSTPNTVSFQAWQNRHCSTGDTCSAGNHPSDPAQCIPPPPVTPNKPKLRVASAEVLGGKTCVQMGKTIKSRAFFENQGADLSRGSVRVERFWLVRDSAGKIRRLASADSGGTWIPESKLPSGASESSGWRKLKAPSYSSGPNEREIWIGWEIDNPKKYGKRHYKLLPLTLSRGKCGSSSGGSSGGGACRPGAACGSPLKTNVQRCTKPGKTFGELERFDYYAKCNSSGTCPNVRFAGRFIDSKMVKKKQRSSARECTGRDICVQKSETVARCQRQHLGCDPDDPCCDANGVPITNSFNKVCATTTETQCKGKALQERTVRRFCTSRGECESDFKQPGSWRNVASGACIERSASARRERDVDVVKDLETGRSVPSSIVREQERATLILSDAEILDDSKLRLQSCRAGTRERIAGTSSPAVGGGGRGWTVFKANATLSYSGPSTKSKARVRVLKLDCEGIHGTSWRTKLKGNSEAAKASKGVQLSDRPMTLQYVIDAVIDGECTFTLAVDLFPDDDGASKYVTTDTCKVTFDPAPLCFSGPCCCDSDHARRKLYGCSTAAYVMPEGTMSDGDCKVSCNGRTRGTRLLGEQPSNNEKCGDRDELSVNGSRFGGGVKTPGTRPSSSKLKGTGDTAL